MILQAVQILVALPANLASVRLLLLHTHRARVRNTRRRVDDGECAVGVLLELLVLVTVLLVVFEAVLVLIRFLATDDGTLERFDLLRDEASGASEAVEKLLLADTFGKFAVRLVGKGFVAVCLLAEEAFGRVVNGAGYAVVHAGVGEVGVVLHHLIVDVEVGHLGVVVKIWLGGCAGHGRVRRGAVLL